MPKRRTREASEPARDHVRRAAPRYELSRELTGRTEYLVDIQLVDLSTTGALIEHHRYLKPGSSIGLRLPLEGEPVPVRATVVHCSVHGVKRARGLPECTIYRIGVRFDELADEARQRIQDLILERLQTERREQPRLYIGAVAQLKEDVELKAINLGPRGGLFAVRHPLEFASEHDFRFRLPQAEVRARGVVRHCQAWAHAESEPRFQVGVEFLEFYDDGAERVLEFLASLDKDGATRPAR